MKTTGVIGLGIIAFIINIVIYAGLFCGGVYFVLWALKHFNIIGG